VRPSGWTFVFLNFYVFRIRKFRKKTNIRLLYWSRFFINIERLESWPLIWNPTHLESWPQLTGRGSSGDWLTRSGKKFVTPNQDVLVTRLFYKSMRKCCAEEYVESWVNIHQICRNIQIITSESTSKDCMGQPGLRQKIAIKPPFNVGTFIHLSSSKAMLQRNERVPKSRQYVKTKRIIEIFLQI
jgi:hypothetical protein